MITLLFYIYNDNHTIRKYQDYQYIVYNIVYYYNDDIIYLCINDIIFVKIVPALGPQLVPGTGGGGDVSDRKLLHDLPQAQLQTGGRLLRPAGQSGALSLVEIH